MMPRSRQMSAMTAPIGRRRTSAAICCRRGQAITGSTPGQVLVRDEPSGRGVGGSGGGGSGGRRLAVGGSARRRRARRPAGGVADDPGFECLGTEQAAGDAREDQGDIAGAERVGVAAERGGELPAVVDELTDEAEKAAGAAGFGVGGGLGGGHERQMSTGVGPRQGNYSQSSCYSSGVLRLEANCGRRLSRRRAGHVGSPAAKCRPERYSSRCSASRK